MFVCFMLRRPSPSLLRSVYHTKIFVIKKFIFIFSSIHSFIQRARKNRTEKKDENMFSSHEDVRQQIKIVMYQKAKRTTRETITKKTV